MEQKEFGRKLKEKLQVMRFKAWLSGFLLGIIAMYLITNLLTQ